MKLLVINISLTFILSSYYFFNYLTLMLQTNKRVNNLTRAEKSQKLKIEGCTQINKGYHTRNYLIEYFF